MAALMQTQGELPTSKTNNPQQGPNRATVAPNPSNNKALTEWYWPRRPTSHPFEGEDGSGAAALGKPRGFSDKWLPKWQGVHNYSETANGRLWVLWRNSIQFSVLDITDQCVIGVVKTGAEEFVLSAVYACNPDKMVELESIQLDSLGNSVSGEFLKNERRVQNELFDLLAAEESFYRQDFGLAVKKQRQTISSIVSRDGRLLESIGHCC
ncbi:hypothetical protein V6N13_028528 [Hibiscus sabdariffa]